MPKVYLSPAYHWFNTCSVPGCDETTHNNLYMDALEPFLTACGIEWKRGTRRVPKSGESGTELMKKAVAESNAWGADVHYVSHTNAFDGSVKGYRPIIYPGSEGGEKLANFIIAERRKIYDGPVRLNERDDLYELRVPKAVSYYEEHIFHDNLEEATWFHDNLRNIARATCKGMCAYFGIPFVDPYVENDAPAVEAPAVDASTGTVEVKVLRKGGQGSAVKALQLLLIGNGYSCGSAGADGDFGNGTLGAVKKYQQAKSLAVDGVVGAKTWKQLLA